jgi:hypothetical protein
MFWFDMDGCSTRSPVAFQFEFCVDLSGFDEYSDCPTNEFQTVEREMQKGLGQNSTLALVQFGSTILRKVGDEIKCIGPTDHHNLTTNKLRGRVALQDDKLTICGVVVTKETSCSNEACLRDSYDKVLGPFESHVYSRALSTSLHSSAGDGLQMAKVVASSLTTRKLVFPSTVPTEDKSLPTIKIHPDSTQHTYLVHCVPRRPYLIDGSNPIQASRTAVKLTSVGTWQHVAAH